ncbi:hypothetical protein K8I31_11485, partial [bacterium]|nr:hypothetical protein [bacterium]
LLLVANASVCANQAALIVCGSGGETEYAEKFMGWGERLQRVLTEQFHFEPNQVALLTESPHDAGMLSNLLHIKREIDRWAGPESEIETAYIFLIGHGSFFAQEAKFHIPGKDLTAVQLDEWLDALSLKRVVVLDASSCSAGFINALSGPGRTICTATKSVSENNATEYMRFFLEGIEGGGADRNFDERISFLEAASRAAELTQAWYETEGFLATEHSLLDDNGDQLGTRLPIEAQAAEGQDGALAADCFLLEFSFPDGAPQELVQNYQAAMREIQSLKDQKELLQEDEYYKQLETLLVKAAKLNRQIRQPKSSTINFTD